MPLPLEMSSDFARGPGNSSSTSSSSVWQRYVDITFLVANCVILLGTSMVGIGANVFVTWAVYHQKSLRTWNNALLVNLAVIDFLRCAVDCPVILVIVLTVHLRGQADAVICDLQMASFSFSCCIQLVTLACISAERYQAIAHPFKITERKRRILFFIPLTWTFAIVVAAVCVTFVRDSPVYVKCHGSRLKSVYKDTFGLYILIPLWTACFALIIGFYSSIFAIVTAHSRKIYDKGVNPAPKQEKKEEEKKAEMEKKEEKKVEEMPASQTDGKQMTVESVPRVEKVAHSKSKVSIMEPTGAPQKPTETVSVSPVPSHNEKVAVPTKGPDKPPDEKPLKQPTPTPKDAKGDSGGCKTQTKGRVAGAGSSETERKTPLVANPVIQVKEQRSNRETEGHPGADKGPGEKGQDKIQTQESKSPAMVPVAPKEPTLPGKEPGGPEEPAVLPLLIDLEQGKVNDEVGPTVVGLPAVNDQVVGLPAVNDDVVPTVVGLPAVNDQVVGLPAVNDDVVPTVVGLPAGDTVDNQDMCMVSVVRRPAPATTTAAAAADEAMTGAVCMMPSKATGNKKKESKLAKRSGYIILTFLLFWLPLITTILVNVLVFQRSDSQMEIIQDVEVLFISIACMTSLTDPIIYAAVNPQFRTEFYRMRNKLKAQWKKR
ncbi:uncharacterized protein LOC130389055 [Gadus chalcogrammus]|uniref:uncharacterized protein LOC130389055 n=1 Tax=Gadus chalcogrammus TaxID=1042646 RepID=UPI0024C4B99F|nr:uncharacterized protein LOC130389055 [Gadus chalcogrammus]